MPFIPFMLGAVVGSAITYVAKDASSQEALKDTGSKVTSGVGALTGKVTGMFKKSEDTDTEDVADVVEDSDTKDTAVA